MSNDLQIFSVGTSIHQHQPEIDLIAMWIEKCTRHQRPHTHRYSMRFKYSRLSNSGINYAWQLLKETGCFGSSSVVTRTVAWTISSYFSSAHRWGLVRGSPSEALQLSCTGAQLHNQLFVADTCASMLKKKVVSSHWPLHNCLCILTYLYIFYIMVFHEDLH